jgi:hypothetical protein
MAVKRCWGKIQLLTTDCYEVCMYNVRSRLVENDTIPFTMGHLGRYLLLWTLSPPSQLSAHFLVGGKLGFDGMDNLVFKLQGLHSRPGRAPQSQPFLFAPTYIHT